MEDFKWADLVLNVGDELWVDLLRDLNGRIKRSHHGGLDRLQNATRGAQQHAKYYNISDNNNNNNYYYY